MLGIALLWRIALLWGIALWVLLGRILGSAVRVLRITLRRTRTGGASGRANLTIRILRRIRARVLLRGIARLLLRVALLVALLVLRELLWGRRIISIGLSMRIRGIDGCRSRIHGSGVAAADSRSLLWNVRTNNGDDRLRVVHRHMDESDKH